MQYPTTVSVARTARKIPTTHQLEHSVSVRALLEIDVVSLLARRSGIDLASVRHQLSAFGMEVR